MKDAKICVESKIGESLSGIEMPLLTITNFNSNKIPIDERKVVIATGLILILSIWNNFKKI